MARDGAGWRLGGKSLFKGPFDGLDLENSCYRPVRRSLPGELGPGGDGEEGRLLVWIEWELVVG